MTIYQEEVRYCLESSFIIDLLNGKKNAIQVFEEIMHAPLTIASVASIALFELLRGDEKNPKKVEQIEKLRKLLKVLPFGENEAEEASKVERAIRKRGFTISPLDLLIGTTAKTNGAILVSNDSDYLRIEGLKVKSY